MQHESPEIKKARETLDRLFGIAKGREKPRLTDEQKEKIALEMTPEKGDALLRKYGFKIRNNQD